MEVPMFAWINFAVLLFASILLLFFYVRSARPAGREKIIGPRAYRLCFYDRLVAGALEFVITANFILHYFFPLATPLPQKFPWAWWISLVIAVAIGIPATILLVVGSIHAGEETIHPKKEHIMYGGIYTKLRHPQAVGEAFLFPVITILLNSPLLTLFSLIYFPIIIIMCYAEEQDLMLRYGDAYVDYCKRTGAFFPKRFGAK
jgi:protein-S-isoprenylcysteine O-methyltransferase Ste14